VVSRAKNNPAWPWMPGSSGMDALKTAGLGQGRWRLGEDGYIEKGPFPRDKAGLNVTLVGMHPESGEAILNLTPRHAGESPVIHFSTTPEVTDRDPRVEDLESFSATAGTLYFWVKDPTGQYESGPPTRWLADLKVRHQVEPAGDMRIVTLQCTPPAEMTYSLDGSNPKDGRPYEQPFEVGPSAARLLVYAKSGEASKTADFQIPASGDGRMVIDEAKPARMTGKKVTLDTTDRVFACVKGFRDQPGTRFKGVRIEIGEGEHTVTVRFQEREITAAMIEGAVTGMREVLQETQAPVTITIAGGIQFENGFGAREFARIAGIELRPGDLVQDAE
jgi:hypothetical protein